MPERVAAADTVVFLDLPVRVCVWRVVDRALCTSPDVGARRTDLAYGCDEQIDQEFLAWVHGFNRTERPRILALLRSARASKRVVHLRSSAAADRWLASLAIEL